MAQALCVVCRAPTNGLLTCEECEALEQRAGGWSDRAGDVSARIDAHLRAVAEELVVEAQNRTPAPVTVLSEAAEITSGARRRAYGHPRDNHGNTAAFWSAYLARKYGLSVELTARDVCLMQVLLKVSRDANMEARDNLVDICGYARNAEQAGE